METWEYLAEPNSEQGNPYWHKFRVYCGSAGIMEGAAHNAHGQGPKHARLLAAAPDMLAALESYLAAHDNAALTGRLSGAADAGFHLELMGIARAAITKARGNA